ncbi:MAG: hypothetical protein HC842_06735 [Cytophagales bacterium]|nr:hypothetical protein [Cytophagales bacterium]
MRPLLNTDLSHDLLDLAQVPYFAAQLHQQEFHWSERALELLHELIPNLNLFDLQEELIHQVYEQLRTDSGRVELPKYKLSLQVKISAGRQLLGCIELRKKKTTETASSTKYKRRFPLPRAKAFLTP